jgi:hypothetical protein
VKPSSSLLIVASLCLLLTSCITDSVNPLSSPDSAQADARLVGEWRGGTDSDPDTCRFSITKAPWMHVDIIHPNEKREPNEQPDSYDFFPSVIGKETFLNVVMIGKDDSGHPTKTYLFIRYKFSGTNVLKMWMMSDELTAAAVRAGKLKGLVKQNGATLGQPSRPDVDVTLQDLSAHIVNFFQSANLDELFNNKLNGFERVSPTDK